LGPNALPATAATPALTPADLAAAVGLASPARGAPRPPGAAGLALRGARSLARGGDPAGADALAAAAGMTVDRALAALLELEIAGHLRRLPDGRYVPT